MDDNGLVSSAAYAGYTVGNVVEEVSLEDSALESYVREQLGKAAGDSLMSDELWSIEELELPAEVTTLNDLTRFAGLQSLTIHDAASGLDLSVIGQLTTLRKLDLAGCTMSQSLLEQIGTLPDQCL